MLNMNLSTTHNQQKLKLQLIDNFMKRFITKGVILAVLILFGSHASAQPPASVKVADVQEIMMSPVRKVPAMVAAKFIANIKAESRGTIQNMADVGAFVKEGEPIAQQVDSQVKYRTDELNGELKSSEARLTFLKSENKRLNGLVGKKLISPSELEQNKSDLIAAQNNLKQVQARLEQYLDFVGKLDIIAPYDGIVLQQLSQPGQLLNAGEDVVEFMQADQFEVIVNVPVRYKSQIQTGAIWQIEAKDLDGNPRVIDTSISRFVRAARGQSRTIEVHLAIKPEDDLWPGEAVSVFMPTQTRQKVVAVPRDALVIRKSGAFVYTVVDGKSHQVDVKTGMAEGDLIEVKGLLSGGDVVIIRGNERLRNDQAVSVIE